jgi:hypothetical protein
MQWSDQLEGAGSGVGPATPKTSTIEEEVTGLNEYELALALRRQIGVPPPSRLSGALLAIMCYNEGGVPTGQLLALGLLTSSHPLVSEASRTRYLLLFFMLTLLLMPLAGLCFWVGLDFVTPSL